MAISDTKYQSGSYTDRVEQAIEANDVEALVEFAYGYPCRCTKLKGEPLCVCQMQAQALRAKVVPLALFKGRIERVG
ncbi:MAG: hypothetical protein JWR89_4652 [Tardiphaga sp.]|uniref:hypothetical protein n=1 Tax=Tardiphaga sp. TaxID=1926292 RepID=UPI00261A89F2|nr:hypothetical protein [Tardiphaga sp.]MDB5504750.1 hypothetical protein [Tardiphaga sp.]